MYKQCKQNEFGMVPQAVLRIADNAFIPFDPDNTDYQAYLKWVEAGNTPQAADAATEPADEQGA
jgi:hypothetical protein